jgi:hypothetical protein
MTLFKALQKKLSQAASVDSSIEGKEKISQIPASYRYYVDYVGMCTTCTM